MDIKSAYLNGLITEDIFMHQPKGYEEKGSEMKVTKLNKGLYGLKQVGWEWYATLHAFLIQIGFQHTHADHSVFISIGDSPPSLSPSTLMINYWLEVMSTFLTPFRTLSVPVSSLLILVLHPGFWAYTSIMISMQELCSLSSPNTLRAYCHDMVC